MKKLKVFLVMPVLAMGGIERMVLEIAKNINKNEFDVTLISFYKNQNSIYSQLASQYNINVKYFNKKKGLDLKLILEIKKYFNKEKPDIVHTHSASYAYVILGCITSKVKCMVHTVHNEAEKELPNEHRTVMKFAYKKLKCIPVSISDYIEKTVKDLYKLKAVECIYNGVDTKQFTPNHLKKEDDKIVFINVGRMCNPKNQVLLIEAFADVIKINGNCRLSIVGDGELKPIINKRIKELGIEKYVTLYGIQKNVENFLNQSDIFVLSSEYEGLPLAVLEAMACGLPIISTKAGGVVDIVDEDNGILVNIYDKLALSKAMIKLSKDENLRYKMACKSYKKSKEFSIEKMVEKYEQLYKKYID